MIGFALFGRARLSLALLFLIELTPLTGGSDHAQMSRMIALDFEVFGVVQGVFFRKIIDKEVGRLISREVGPFELVNYTQSRGRELGLKGWCMNTPQGTVVGQLEGEKSQIAKMKEWLQHTGSPQSRIDKAEFRNEREITTSSFTNFQIRK